MAKRKEAGYCPFLPTALVKNGVWYEIVEQYSIENLSAFIEEKIYEFKQLPPVNSDRKYKTLILIFPNIPFRPAQEMLDAVQEELKHFIIHHKIVIGGFSSNNEHNTLHFILRYLIEQDLSFLLKTKSLTDKVNYLQSYLKTFKTTLTNKQYELATYELNKAKKYQTNKV
ncbi:MULTISPECIES: DUF6875 domain-containing protein [Heyndrickxia]|uniref:DUF6875 domain-containing protein n=1 Tax=Heyndrickxia TaxID=2837504 RepID=UPI002E1D9DB1|nr:hypothetical protein [Heyndrickxia coagulans]